MALTRVSTGTVWEQAIGYARAVRSGDLVAVSATSAADAEGRPLAEDPYGQTKAILAIVDDVLRRLASRLGAVIRLRIYYADPAIGTDVVRALQEAFPEGIPALTTVRVAGLSDPAFHLEIEADAVTGEWREEAEEADPDWDETAD